MNTNLQSLSNETNSTPSSEARRSSLLTSGTIGPGSAAANNVIVDAQSVSIDMKGGLSGTTNTAMASVAASKEGSNNDDASGSATPSGTGNSIGMNANGLQQQQQQQTLQLQAQLAALQGMNNFGTAGLNPQLAAMAGMNMNPAMMTMMASFGGANANANAMATGASSTNSSDSRPASTNAAAGEGNNKNNSAVPASSSNGASDDSTPTPNNDDANQSNKRDSTAAFMDNLNPSFLAGGAAAASPADAMAGSGAGAGAGQAGMDAMLSRSSLLAAGVGGGVAGMGGMNLAAVAAANPMMAQLMMQQQMQILMQQQQQLQEQMQTANAAGNGNGNDNGDANNNPNANSSANVNGLDASSLAASAAMFGPGGFGIVNPSTATATGMAAAANQRPTKKARKNASSASAIAKGSAAAAASSLSAIANATPIGAAGSNPQPKDLKWLTMLGLLKDYQTENGDCIVPRGYGPNPKLASWVAEQRKQYKLMRDGKPSNITPERVAALNEIEFAWNAQEAAWSRHYSDLQAYKAKFGDCLVPLSYTARPQLGLWVKEQRRHYMLLVQGRKSHMTQARIAQLESVGFVWDSHEATWWDRFNDLKAYQAVHGNCMVPTKYQPNPRLGTWVHHQRRQHRKLKHGKTSHMTHERMEALESIGFCWTPRNGKDGAESD